MRPPPFVYVRPCLDFVYGPPSEDDDEAVSMPMFPREPVGPGLLAKATGGVFEFVIESNLTETIALAVDATTESRPGWRAVVVADPAGEAAADPTPIRLRPRHSQQVFVKVEFPPGTPRQAVVALTVRQIDQPDRLAAAKVVFRPIASAS
jgi:hypothetical protein